jgi:hypothetical protein
MLLVVAGPDHKWLSFALGALAGLVFIFLLKRFRRKEDR